MKNEKLLQYGIPIVIGVVVIYLVTKASRSTSTTSTINRLVPLQGENNTSVSNSDAAKVSAFQTLAEFEGQKLALEGQKISAEAQSKTENLQFRGLQETLGSATEQLKLQIAGVLESERVQSADRRYDVDAQLLAIDRMAQADRDAFNLQANTAYQALMAQIGAVEQIGNQYRGQSLERQGTILNALTSIWNQPRVYDYQSAFGGQRPPPIISQIGDAAGNILRGLVPFF